MGCMMISLSYCHFPTISFGLTHRHQDPRDPKAEVESSEEESSEEEIDANKPEMTREERKAADKARKKAALAQKAATTPAPGDLPSDEEEEVEEAPKKPVRGAGGISVTNPNSAGVVESTLNRKEREAVEAAAAKERYWKLQEQGKTDQAKADMARLAIIRQERDEKARQRKAGMFLLFSSHSYLPFGLLTIHNCRARREENRF